MSHWLKYGATLLHRRVLFSWAFLVGSSSCGIRRYSQLCNLQIPKRKIPAPCGISLPCSVVELKGQQISTSTVFMVSGMETLSRLKEFIWCHCDFRTTPPTAPPRVVFIHTKQEEGALWTGETVTSSSFSCSAAACSQLIGIEESENMLYSDSQSQRFSPNSLELNNARKTIKVNDDRRLRGSSVILWCKMSPFTRKSRKMGYWSN